MRIALESLNLRYFKGIKKFELDLNSQNAAIYGDNATGKTSLYDAFLWLLFEKDSLNRANFGIKTLGPDGEPVNGLDHVVEAVLSVDGRPLTLKKVYYEKWTKQRGSAEKVFSGHTADCFVNDVPVKSGEYTAKVAELINENIFRLLTDPRFFNEQIKWGERRKLLLEVCGDISDADVIGSDKRLGKLSGVLKDRTIDDHKKVIAAQRKKINEQLERIPIRIDEVQNSLPDISALNFSEIRTKIEELRFTQDAKRQTISRIEAGGEIAEKEKKVAQIDAEILRMRSEHDEKKRKALKGLIAEVDSLRSELRKAKNDLSEKQDEADRKKRQIATSEKDAQALREKWRIVNDEEFEYSQDTVCPTCGQAIPESQLEEAREKALKAFNLEKSTNLEQINAEGKEIVASAADLKIAYSNLSDEIEKTKAKVDSLTAKVAEADAKVKATEDRFEDFEATDGSRQKMVLKLKLKEAIDELRADSKKQITEVRAAIADLETDIQTLQTDLSKEDQHKKALERIAELQKEQKTLSAELEKLDEQLFLTEEFVKAKVRLLESKINSKFRVTRFKLFNTQVNGGIEECCEAVYGGVPYTDLNNAARINVGLDVINTLSEHYDFSAPIFVDNREAVTRLIDVDAQVISLVVSEPDKKLRVELEQKEIKEAV